MGYDDFCRCTPSQFNATVEQWNRVHTAQMRGSWERARMMATVFLQPYSKRRLKPTDVMTFEWEKKTDKAGKVEKSTRERMEYVKGLLKKSE